MPRLPKSGPERPRSPGGESPPPAPAVLAARVTWKVALTVALVWLCGELDRRGRHGTDRAVQWITTGV